MGWSLERGDREETHGHGCGQDTGHKGEKGDEQAWCGEKAWLCILALPLAGRVTLSWSFDLFLR